MLLPLIIAAASNLIYPPSGYTITTKVESPNHTFTVESYFSDGDERKAEPIWVVPIKDRKAQPFLLYDPDKVSPFSVPSIRISPDEHWILRHEKLCHGQNAAWLYEQSSPLHFTEIPLSEQAWQFFSQQSHHAFRLDYRFMIEVGEWPTKSNRLLIQLHGDDRNIYVSEWFCYYDLQMHKFFVDSKLAQKNKDSIQPSENK
jgi:hypothetical protein